MPDTHSDTQTVLGNGVKLFGEAIVPGASEMLEGHIGSGGLHSALAVAAVGLLSGAPVLAGLAVLAIRINSFSRSVTGQNFFEDKIDRAMTSAQNAVSGPGHSSTSSRSSSTGSGSTGSGPQP